MRKRPSTGSAGSASPVERRESYEIVEVPRGELKNAPYNPRTLSAEARRRLRVGIEKFGLLAPPTWNKRTGNLVGGHKRIEALDALHGTTDYTVRVAAVDLDDVREREANILLNNQEAQGEWLLPELGELLRTPGLDIDATGFDLATVYRMFGEAPQGTTHEQIDALAQKIRDVQSAFVATGKKFGRAGQLDYYLVVVFRDWEQRKAFTAALGLDDNRYQDGRALLALLQRDGKEPETPAHSAEGQHDGVADQPTDRAGEPG
jgi:hypothetical protein